MVLLGFKSISETAYFKYETIASVSVTITGCTVSAGKLASQDTYFCPYRLQSHVS
jgi:hypothetical protein